MNNDYLKLTKAFDRYYILKKINSTLSWDTQVKMPKDGFYIREKQLNLINQEIDNSICNKEISKLINNLDPSNLSKREQRNFFLMKRDFLHKNSLPQKLREDFSKIALKTEFIWPEARKNNDYKLFDQYFSKLIKLLREISQIKSEKLNLSKYETLLDLYCPSVKEEELDKVFTKLENKLPNLINKIIANQTKPKLLHEQNIPKELQKKLFLAITEKFGITNKWCLIDESEHPFCTGYNGDVRITTKYNECDFTSAFMGIIHESGHAIYDSNLPQNQCTKAIGQDAGMALHESQSLFYEMQIARSMEFCKFALPHINKYLNLSISAADLYNNLNYVKKDYIRIDSDEVTYPLHIILRYNIEKDLINKKIETKDIPEIWAIQTEKLFQLKAPKNHNGCLQDIHWSDGSLGYFPTYSLGAIYASQIANKFRNILSDFDNLIEAGNFAKINEVLKENIHKKAHSQNAEEIITEFCGSKLDADCYLRYLEKKFLP